MSYDLVLSCVLADPLLSQLEHKAYALATIKHECADTWLPITERGTADYLSKYDRMPVARWLSNTEPGDGERFKGRGYVQITGRGLYKRFSTVTGVDLVANPELAEVHEHAYKILSVGMSSGLFTGKRLSDYINNVHSDYINARRIINGIDKAALIAGYARDFEAELRRAAGYPAQATSS